MSEIVSDQLEPGQAAHEFVAAVDRVGYALCRQIQYGEHLHFIIHGDHVAQNSPVTLFLILIAGEGFIADIGPCPFVNESQADGFALEIAGVHITQPT
ncbi:hypothetical protein GALL_519430 [mine drainage metagenome]|uniref:Uncharacterized protein n=1 Tax=mine drainage metagenome TaxID=410659 RepID=A0A1J5PG09_9ZZZZ